jgi:hypothetical protein
VDEAGERARQVVGRGLAVEEKLVVEALQTFVGSEAGELGNAVVPTLEAEGL